MKIDFFGASQTVTGSCYLITVENIKILIDCGMFQGSDVEHLNIENFRFNPAEINLVILTHAHLDHCGLIPKLVKEGFNGKIICTPYTYNIAKLILLDSAKIQSKRAQLEQLYTTNDVVSSLDLFTTIDLDKEFIHKCFKIIFRKASHVLGAASVELYSPSGSITFSGDLGRQNDALIGPYNNNYNTTDSYVMESLYGDRVHPDISESNHNLTTIVNNTFLRGGIVMIPVFALHRSMLVIDIIQKLIDQRLLDNDTKIILDSPLAVKINEQYGQYNSRLKLENYRNLLFKNSDLKKYNKGSKRIILAGGGMVNGGRILSYLKSYISDKRNSIIFVGYQAPDTLGHTILNGAKTIDIDYKSYKVASEVVKLEGYSAHADQMELIWWINRFNKENIKNIYLVHSEFASSSILKTLLQNSFPNSKIIIPEMYHSEEIIS